VSITAATGHTPFSRRSLRCDLCLRQLRQALFENGFSNSIISLVNIQKINVGSPLAISFDRKISV
jgi:hypothetical protein